VPSRDYQEWARARMSRLVADHADALEGLVYRAHLLEDYASHGLLEFTRNHAVDMLVVGRTGESQALSDSVGDVLLKVLQSVPTTTCIVPAGDDEPQR
jgi:hypothetical protein